jgi:hypothetical protein
MTAVEVIAAIVPSAAGVADVKLKAVCHTATRPLLAGP